MVKVLNMLEKLGFVQRSGNEDEIVPPATEASAAVEAAATEEPPPPEIRHIRTTAFDDKVAANVGQTERPEDFPFSKIYSSAGVTEPEHGFTVFTLIEMMESAEFNDLDDITRAKVIRGLLRNLPSGPVSVSDIVNDAAQRDQALDAFERFLADRVSTTEAELKEKNEALQFEIDELTIRNTELIDNNLNHLAKEQQRLEAWQERKRNEENRLFEAVRPFAEENPVTLSEDE